MTGIIRMIIDGGHRAELIEAFDKHTFMIHIGEAHRTDHLGHSSLAAPFFGRPEQSFDHFRIVDKVDKTEAGFALAGALVDHTVDYRRDAAHRLAVAPSHERLCLTVIESRIFRWHESLDLIEYQRGHVTTVAPIQIYSKLHVFLKPVAGRAD